MNSSIGKVQQLLLSNRHLSLQMKVDELDMSKDTVWKAVIQDLKKREVCSHFVPHALTAEQEVH
jgi:urease accessory protein UreE